MKKSLKVQDYMTEMPHTIGEDMTLTVAMERMREFHVRHLPVLYGGKIRGVISDRDIRLALSVYPAAKDLKVGDVMTEDPYLVEPTTDMERVAYEMATHKYGCAIVSDKGAAVGIFTMVDAARLLAELLEVQPDFLK